MSRLCGNSFDGPTSPRPQSIPAVTRLPSRRCDPPINLFLKTLCMKISYQALLFLNSSLSSVRIYYYSTYMGFGQFKAEAPVCSCVNVAVLLMSRFFMSTLSTQVPPLVFMANEKEPKSFLSPYMQLKLKVEFFFVCDLVIYAQCKSCCCFIPDLPIESYLVTMMYSLSTYKLFLSQYYLLLTFNKILKLIFHCR